MVASPVLVGAVTTLIVIVSVFLAYNANKGLPFVPTYDLSATLPSGSNLVEGNEAFANAAQGINVNEASNNTVKANRVYDNTESGIGIGQTAKDNVVQNNDVRGNQQDGLRLVSEASQTDVRDNVIGENVRYGVYVDSDGPFAMAGNTIWKNRTGVMLKGTPTDPSSGNNIFSNTEMDVKNG